LPQSAADERSLHYESYGDGPPVVLLHGFTSTGASWAQYGWVDALVDAGLNAITLDLPGHGKSGAVVDASTSSLAAGAVALLDELGHDRAALFGYSFGGGVALQIALERPERVLRIAIGGVGDPALHPAAVVRFSWSSRRPMGTWHPPMSCSIDCDRRWSSDSPAAVIIRC
jgi:pimeloyl-ACP methyl ester carboxylesterase